MKLLIGLMSGTSMDGIDAALVDVHTNTLIAGVTCGYEDKVRHLLQEMMSNQLTSPAALSKLNTLLGREFARAALSVLAKAQISPHQVSAIGSHGQTICHDALADIPYTLQLGCAHTIAEETGIDVVADFRTRDVVLGGQGAPFAPIYHQSLFSDCGLPLAVVNIGGVANITYLLQDGGVLGHDIGPGNCLMDAWAEQHIHKPYDANGTWASTGQVSASLLASLREDPYFKLPPPKSIGKEYFSLLWLSPHLRGAFSPEDIQATLVALTAVSIAEEINLRTGVQRVLICGGGVHNGALLTALREALPDVQVDSTIRFGIDPDFIEAMMFAWLAEQALCGKAIDLTSITGAKKPTILGISYPVARPNSHRLSVFYDELTQ